MLAPVAKPQTPRHACALVTAALVASALGCSAANRSSFASTPRCAVVDIGSNCSRHMRTRSGSPIRALIERERIYVACQVEHRSHRYVRWPVFGLIRSCGSLQLMHRPAKCARLFQFGLFDGLTAPPAF